ncbi:MAG: DUF1540 domain-containing protein [Clostridia bacterium]|jgi:hypothetical protein|nr:DUF1540 domain-containing protein [Clostridia bacterium]MDD3862724.1 DUF1540 domain-containing protein [Clostridia bacterium]MDD4408253.1 DUF1540 domain-containing protein [Clostridia bacterium]
MDIICRKTECEHNNNYVCMAKGILVNKKIMCSTYIPTDKQEPDYSKSLLERVPEKYGPHRPSHDLNLLCKANCLFNNNGQCEANGITVNAIEEKPICITFLKK